MATRDRFMLDSPLGDEVPPFGGNVTSPEGYLLALWMHECQRVFCDKMTTHEDKRWIESCLMGLCKEQVGGDLVRQVEEPLYFIDFLREPVYDEDTGEVVDEHPSNYEAIKDLADIRKRVEELQVMHNVFLLLVVVMTVTRLFLLLTVPLYKCVGVYLCCADWLWL
jgi:dynein heavy chain